MTSTSSPSTDAVRRADLPATARLHADGLPHGFFARLGRRFLAAYHATFVDGPAGVAIVARDHDGVAGVVVGAVRAREHSRWTVRRRGARLAVVGAWALVTHPVALAIFLRTRVGRYLRGIWRRLRPSPTSTAPTRPAREGPARRGRAADVAVLAHVVVDPRARGNGIGATLVAAFVEEVRARGASTVRLVTRAEDGAAGLYERLGWHPRRSRPDRDGTVMLEYELDLSREGSGPS